MARASSTSHSSIAAALLSSPNRLQAANRTDTSPILPPAAHIRPFRSWILQMIVRNNLQSERLLCVGLAQMEVSYKRTYFASSHCERTMPMVSMVRVQYLGIREQKQLCSLGCLGILQSESVELAISWVSQEVNSALPTIFRWGRCQTSQARRSPLHGPAAHGRYLRWWPGQLPHIHMCRPRDSS